MQRVTDYLDDPHFRQRRFLVPMRHPLLAEPIPSERSCAVFGRMPDSPLASAPLAGQQTRDIAKRLLGLSAAEIGELIEAGVLEEPGTAGAALAPYLPTQGIENPWSKR
jgi:crotonobetainyl-CoA:carnitine CoA-transferase CaiB-like acyl-CoA transferase